MKLERRVDLLGCAAICNMTQVFAVAGSEGIAPPYSLLSMSLSVLPLCSVLLLGRDE